MSASSFADPPLSFLIFRMPFYLWNSGICWYAAQSSGSDKHGPSSFLLGANVLGTAIALSANIGLSSSSNLDLDPDSEVGRENMGLLVVALWFLLLTINARMQFWYSLILFIVATSVCMAAGLVPMLLVDKEKLVEHCSGMGPFQ